MRPDLEAQRLPPGPRRDTQPYGNPAVSAAPGCLAVALVDERHGRGHLEFRAGVPVWMPGPVRFAPPPCCFAIGQGLAFHSGECREAECREAAAVRP